MTPLVTPPYYLSESDALSLMQNACLLHADLLPPWQQDAAKTAEFGAVMLSQGAPEHILFCCGRPFARALVALLEQADAFELAAGMREAIRLGRSLTDEEGLPGVYLNYMEPDTGE